VGRGGVNHGLLVRGLPTTAGSTVVVVSATGVNRSWRALRGLRLRAVG
jgi:hypothetical protein